MDCNTLQIPVELLQSKLPSPQPWSNIVSNLVHLLHLYSNGLSIFIALDHFSLLHRSQQLTSTTSPSHQRLSACKLVDKSPALWHLSLSDGQQIAHFPHSNFTQLNLRLGTTLTIAVKFGEPASRSPAHEDALRIAVNAAKHPSLSDSPDDIRSTAQSAETPSQSGVKLPSTICFPTNAVLVHLNKLTLSSLNLPTRLNDLTLQRVWDQRSLTPDAVFAQVISVDVKSSTLSVQDPPSLSTSQPSVTVHFSEDRAVIVQAFHPGDGLLLMSPTVHPTGNSFDLYTMEATVCMISKHKSSDGSVALCTQSELPSSASGINSHRAASKRKRTDDDLSTSNQLVNVDRVLMLGQPELQPPLVVYARLKTVPYEVDDDMDQWLIDLGKMKLRFHPHGVEAGSFMKGDEIIMTGFRLNPAAEPRSHWEWVAEEVHNLSTMHAVLFSPFMRNIVRGTQVSKCIKEYDGYWTFHVRVRVSSLKILDNRQCLRLTITDSGGHLDEHEAGVAALWDVDMNEHVLCNLFRTVSRNFLQSASQTEFRDISEAFQKDTWLMTLSCHGGKWPVAQVRSCVSINPLSTSTSVETSVEAGS